MTSYPHAQSSLTNILRFLSLMKIEILTSFPHCTQLVQIFDVTQTTLFFSSTTIEDYHTTVFIDLLENSNSTKYHLFQTNYPKFSRQCSLVAADVTRMLETGTNRSSWLQVQFPGSPHRDFHTFLLQNSGDSEELILPFAKSVATKLHYSFFAVYSLEKINVLQLSANQENLVQISYVSSSIPSAFQQTLRKNLESPNFNGWPLVINVCARCGDAVKTYEEEKVWYSVLEATAIVFVWSVNATPEFEKVITLPRDGKNEDGEWDDWLQPLIDGSASIATLQQYSVEGSSVVLYTVPALYDVSCFITAKPKRIRGKGLSKMLMPLSFHVWIGFIASLLVLGIFIEAAIHLRRYHQVWAYIRNFGGAATTFQSTGSIEVMFIFQSMLPAHFHRLTFSALVKPVFDQSGLTSRIFTRNIEKDDVGKFLLGMWFILLIVLGCGYKSKFTSVVVLPEFTRPPTTFRELANSHYVPFAIVWADNLEENFKVFNFLNQ